jgi:hypothetical protein
MYTKSKSPQSSDALGNLDRLLGTWKMSGGAEGQIRYERLEGGHFLMQHVDLEYGGRRIKGVEIVGYLQRIGERRSEEIHSRFYSFLDGRTLDYVYEIEDNTWKIWFGPKGSDNNFVATFTADGDSFSGAWKWHGGGYEVKGAMIK